MTSGNDSRMMRAGVLIAAMALCGALCACGESGRLERIDERD